MLGIDGGFPLFEIGLTHRPVTPRNGSMTDTSCRAKIEAMLVDDPNDPFLRYSLAMELDKEGESEPSLALFRGLMEDSPPQVAAFFMAAQQLARGDQQAEAVRTLRAGIDQAEAQGEDHAAGEMREFLAGLEPSVE